MKAKREYLATKAELELEGVPDLLRMWLSVGEYIADLEDDESLETMWEGCRRRNNKPVSECGCVMCDVRQLIVETKKVLKP